MKKIYLTTPGYVALVDDEDFERVNAIKWRAALNPRSPLYAMTAKRQGGRSGKKIYMHIFIMGRAKGEWDHKDGNGLNNQRENLRDATRSQNACNRKKRDGGSSRFRGVAWNKQSRKWAASIMHKRINYHLGLFKDEVDAATAYNFKAEELFGEFARLNTPDGAL